MKQSHVVIHLQIRRVNREIMEMINELLMAQQLSRSRKFNYEICANKNCKNLAMQTFANALKSAACCRKLFFISIAYVRDLRRLHGEIQCARTFILHNPSLFFCTYSHRHARQTYLFSARVYLYRTHYHETRGSWKHSSNIAHRVVLIMKDLSRAEREREGGRKCRRE